MRLQLDLRLLREERVKRPDDARVAFYLAQTLHTLEMLPEAVQAYQDRIEMGGWYEEVFESLLRKVGPLWLRCNRSQMVPNCGYLLRPSFCRRFPRETSLLVGVLTMLFLLSLCASCASQHRSLQNRDAQCCSGIGRELLMIAHSAAHSRCL